MPKSPTDNTDTNNVDDDEDGTDILLPAQRTNRKQDSNDNDEGENIALKTPKSDSQV